MSFRVSTSTVLRAASKRPTGTPTRAFHSPFAVLGNNSPISSKDGATNTITSQYEKQYDHPPEPVTSHTGYRTYVVSEPDAQSRHYQVPAGAYPTSAPYTSFTPTAAPDTTNVRYSSTSAELLAHGFTTRASTQLGERNPPPDGSVAEKFSKAGVHGAWKVRK